jgi:hypothetical protein
MEIQKGKYRIENRNLEFEVVENLKFQNNGGCYFLRGDNGLGKTSFLEKIIIPALKAETLSYLYIGQDIRTQLYTLRALLSTKGIKVADSDEVELLRLWIEHSQSASVLILDEFDKYFPDYSFIFDWSDAFIQSYIIVTHLGRNHSEAMAKNLKFSNLRLELIDMDGYLKNVRVSYD